MPDLPELERTFGLTGRSGAGYHSPQRDRVRVNVRGGIPGAMFDHLRAASILSITGLVLIELPVGSLPFAGGPGQAEA